MKSYSLADVTERVIIGYSISQKTYHYEPPKMFYEKELFYVLRYNSFFFRISRILAKGINPNIAEESGLRPLHIAAGRGLLKQTKQLLSHGANVNAKDVWGRTPLHYAIKRFNFRMIKLLLNAGADVHQKDSQGKLPLHYAEEQKLKRIYELLFGYNKGDSTIEHKETLLLTEPEELKIEETTVTKKEKPEVVRRLELGADAKRKHAREWDYDDEHHKITFQYTSAKQLMVFYQEGNKTVFPVSVEKHKEPRTEIFTITFPDKIFTVVLKRVEEVIVTPPYRIQKVTDVTIWKQSIKEVLRL